MKAKSASFVEKQIKEAAKEIATESYTMSVGEMISLYKNEEIDLHPDFQRFFRWDSYRKSRFVESLLLGIPIPSVFVSQDAKGKWDVIDGLQRLSTILELTGDLRDADGERIRPALILESTRYIPSLKGHTWETLPEFAKLQIKRSKLDLKIVLNKSNDEAKFELFQRLNTGGMIATEQEIRNCVIIMLNKSFFKWFNSLRALDAFRECCPLTERAAEEQYDLELVSRFLVFRQAKSAELKNITELGTHLTEAFIDRIKAASFDEKLEGKAFDEVFTALNEELGDQAFKKYNHQKQRAEGALLISVFEVMAIGLGFYAGTSKFQKAKKRIKEVHKALWKMREFTENTGSGIGASTRLAVTVSIGRKLFGQ